MATPVSTGEQALAGGVVFNEAFGNIPDLSSLAKTEVPGLEAPVLEAMAVSGMLCNKPTRTHFFYTIARHGFNHEVQITQPLEPSDEQTYIVHFPGYAQHIDSGTGRQLIEHLAHKQPRAHVVAIATDGLGKYGDHVTPENKHLHGFNAMAESDLDIMRMVCGPDASIIVASTSMGARRVVEAAATNLQNSLNPLKIVGHVALVPALLTPLEAHHLEPKLVWSIARDELKELAHLRNKPAQIFRQLGSLASYGWDSSSRILAEYTPLNTLRHELHEPINPETLAFVLKHLPFRIITGIDDPLFNTNLWHEMRSSFPENVKIAQVRGGHALFKEPDKAANRMSRDIDELPLLAA